MSDSVQLFIQAVVVSAILFVALALFARSQQREGKAVGRAHNRRVVWLGSYSVGFQRALDVLGALDVEVIEADPNQGSILARTGMTLASVGSTVQVRLQTTEGVTIVHIQAAPSASLFDLGQARSLVERFLQAWDRLPGPVAEDPAGADHNLRL
jgi:hypothetical protein